MHPALLQVAHRPWPVPAARWTWRQRWEDVLFAHWPIAAEQLQVRLPPGLEVDRFAGQAWIGVVPFRMSGVARRPWPAMPGFAGFPELNVRTYVVCDGRPGVWFFRLEAASRLAVSYAKRVLHLPYVYAKMRARRGDDGCLLASTCRDGAIVRAFNASYVANGTPRVPASGTLEAWWVERYALYAADPRGTLYRTDVHHAPWLVQPAGATLEAGPLFESVGLSVAATPPHLLFSPGVDVVAWPAVAVGLASHVK